MYDPHAPRSLEKYSSAITLSDMEVFIFPELIYSLMLANIMSPEMWSWREDSWFRKMHKLNDYRKVLRVKQFIMDNFDFNLDLDTWGLTTKQRELARFSGFVDEATLAQSNALFGYEGDKYYFDMDIRRHFGLDKYTSDVIPYWKTETLEAMKAFRHKEGYPHGAGECVSLSVLYAGALFVVAGIPLEDIYMMATPLHSQNFVDVRDGVITNNRRVVTKNMWFNGTELSAKARRALANERVTVVAHRTGYIHTLYDQATIAPEVYQRFGEKLRDFLKTDITFGLVANFLRYRSDLQKCFQLAHKCCGKPRYIEAERVYAYEHGSPSRVGDTTQSALIHEIDEDEFYPEPLPDRIMLDQVESLLQNGSIDIDQAKGVDKLKSSLQHRCLNVEQVVHDLFDFCRIEPRLPSDQKTWLEPKPVDLEGVSSPLEAIERLEDQREESETVDLAFAAYRDLTRTPWRPFLKAAIERNPVSIEGAEGMEPNQAYERLTQMCGQSIYSGTRMAQPDEVWNYGRGDGLEKAICLLNILSNRPAKEEVSLDGDESKVVVRCGGAEYVFTSRKGLQPPRPEDFAF